MSPHLLGVCKITVWGHDGTQPQWEILFSMLLTSPNGAGTNTLLPTGCLESSAMPLPPSQHPLHAALPAVPQVRPGCGVLDNAGALGRRLSRGHAEQQ